MNATILVVPSNAFEVNPSTGFVIGTLIGLLILGYLFYSLVNSDKF